MKRGKHTILKCTGGPPKEVNPMYQFSLKEVHIRGPISSRLIKSLRRHVVGSQRWDLRPILGGGCCVGGGDGGECV